MISEMIGIQELQASSCAVHEKIDCLFYCGALGCRMESLNLIKAY